MGATYQINKICKVGKFQFVEHMKIRILMLVSCFFNIDRMDTLVFQRVFLFKNIFKNPCKLQKGVLISI